MNAIVSINARQTFANASGVSYLSVKVTYNGETVGVMPFASGSHGMEWTYAAELFEAAGIPSPDPEGREWTHALMGGRGVKVTRDYVYVSRRLDLHSDGKGGTKIYAKWRGGALVDALSLI